MRRPEYSEKADHQRGQKAMPTLERESVRSARLRLVWRLDAVSCNEAVVYQLISQKIVALIVCRYLTAKYLR